MAKLNVGAKTQAETPLRRNPPRGASAKAAQPESESHDQMSEIEEPVIMPAPKGKGKGKGATKASTIPSAEVEPLSNARETLAAVTEPAEDAVEMDEEDAPKITEKPTAASKAPATIRKTRANARAESKMPEPMVVSAYKEVTDTDEDEAPKVMVKSKAAGMKPKTMRKTRGQNVLGQIAEAGTQEEQEFYDAEEVPVKAKNDKVESEGDEEQVPESVKPVKKRGRPAKKALNDDDLMVIEEAAEETVKTKRGRKPKKAQPPKIKQEEIEDSEDDHETLDQKLATLSLGQMTRDNTDEPVKPKPKQRGRPRKNNQTKKNASLDVSGLDLALTYFIGIRDLAMGDVDDEDVQKVLEMAKQGMETIQAALDGVKEE